MNVDSGLNCAAADGLLFPIFPVVPRDTSKYVLLARSFPSHLLLTSEGEDAKPGEINQGKADEHREKWSEAITGILDTAIPAHREQDDSGGKEENHHEKLDTEISFNSHRFFSSKLDLIYSAVL